MNNHGTLGVSVAPSGTFCTFHFFFFFNCLNIKFTSNELHFVLTTKWIYLRNLTQLIFSYLLITITKHFVGYG